MPVMSPEAALFIERGAAPNRIFDACVLKGERGGVIRALVRGKGCVEASIPNMFDALPIRNNVAVDEESATVSNAHVYCERRSIRRRIRIEHRQSDVVRTIG